MPLNETEQRAAPEFDRGSALRDRGELVEAIAAFSRVIEQLRPEDAKLLSHAHIQVGHCLDKLGRRAECEAAFRAAVEVAPHKELASLGLFHSLLALERRTDAHREMVRFLRLRDSELYRELLAGEYGEEFTDEDRRLVDDARELLALR